MQKGQMKQWEVRYNDSVIRVECFVGRDKLYVNEELQDEVIGSTRDYSRLWGQLPSGEQVKVSVGTVIVNPECRIFINNKLVLSE